MVHKGVNKGGGFTKEEAASPTVVMGLVLLTVMIDVHEKRDVTITDILRTYLSTKIDELVITVLHRSLAELIVLIDPDLYW